MVPGAGLTMMEQMGLADKTQRFTRTDGTHLGTGPGGVMPESMNEFTRLELSAKLFKPPRREVQGFGSRRQLQHPLQYVAVQSESRLHPDHRFHHPHHDYYP